MTTFEVTVTFTVRTVEENTASATWPSADVVARRDTLREELRSRALKGLSEKDPSTGCQTHRNRHGVIQLGKHRARISALIWEAHNDRPLPEGHCVWRTCPTQGCKTPEHLLAGTPEAMAEYRRERGWPYA